MKKEKEENQEEKYAFNYDKYEKNDLNTENPIDANEEISKKSDEIQEEKTKNRFIKFFDGIKEKNAANKVVNIRNIILSLSFFAILIVVLGFYLSQKKVFDIGNKSSSDITSNADMSEPPRKTETDSVKNNTKPSNNGNKKTKSSKKSDDKTTNPNNDKKNNDDNVDKPDPQATSDVQKPKDGQDNDKNQNPDNNNTPNTDTDTKPGPVPSPDDGKDPVPVPTTTAAPKGPGDGKTDTGDDGGGEKKVDKTNFVSFNQVCETSGITKKIRGIYFKKMTQQEINRRYVKAKYKNIFKYDGQGNVKDWVEGDKLYIASSKKIFLKNNPALNSNIAAAKKLRVKYGEDSWGYNYNFGGTDDEVYYQDCERWSNLEEIDFENVDTSMLTYIGPMFYNATKLKRIYHLNNFNTSNATDFSGMFYNCRSLEYIDLSSFDTRKATSMEYMFYGCDRLKTLDLSNFDTSKVRKMNAMLYSKSLQKVYVSNKWSVASVNDPMDNDHHIFAINGVLVGGAGTRCTSTNRQAPAAHIDVPGNPGCLTRK